MHSGTHLRFPIDPDVKHGHGSVTHLPAVAASLHTYLGVSAIVLSEIIF